MIVEQSPLPYLAHYPEADVLTSSDQVIPTVVDDSLEKWEEGDQNLLLSFPLCLYGFSY